MFNRSLAFSSKLADLETEDWKIKNADYTEYYSLVKPMLYYIFYIIDGSIAGIIYLGKVKKRINKKKALCVHFLFLSK